MTYIAFTAGGELPIDADECEREDGVYIFYTTEITKLVHERVERTGIWPFRRQVTVRDEYPRKSKSWVMNLREDYVNILIPAPDASGTEARQRQDREDGPDPKGDGPTLEEGDAPPPPGGLNA